MVNSVLILRGPSVGETDPHFANVTLLAFNENATNGSTSFADQSSDGHTLTGYNGVAWTSSNQAPGGVNSVAFNGTTQYVIDAVDCACYALGAGDYTIEGYIRATGAFDTNGNIFISLGCGGVTDIQFEWEMQDLSPFFGPVTCQVLCSSDGSSWNVSNTTDLDGTTINQNTWYHLATTRQGSTFRLFINGVLQAKTVTSSAALHDITTTTTCHGSSPVRGPMQLGADIPSVSYFNGQMAGWRITKGTCRYSSTFTPPTLPLPTA